MSSTKMMVNLRMRLRGFQEPSTRSDFEGHVEPGKYRVEEYPKAVIKLRLYSLSGQEEWLGV